MSLRGQPDQLTLSGKASPYATKYVRDRGNADKKPDKEEKITTHRFHVRKTAKHADGEPKLDSKGRPIKKRSTVTKVADKKEKKYYNNGKTTRGYNRQLVRADDESSSCEGGSDVEQGGYQQEDDENQGQDYEPDPATSAYSPERESVTLVDPTEGAADQLAMMQLESGNDDRASLRGRTPRPSSTRHDRDPSVSTINTTRTARTSKSSKSTQSTRSTQSTAKPKNSGYPSERRR